MSDSDHASGDEMGSAVAKTMAAAKVLEERLLPIVRATVAPLVRVGVRPPGSVYDIYEPPPVGHAIETYDGGSLTDSRLATEADHERYRAEVARQKLGRRIEGRLMPEQEDGVIDMRVGASVSTVISVLMHLIGSHRSYPGHEACPERPAAGPDLLPPCLTDETLDWFLEKDMLDARNLRAVLRELRAAFTAESALFALIGDLVGFDYHAAP
ncbi:MAG TPA: hypothetical protein VJ694_03695 [Patescibacteria group bacterium]|nr:hypothetical protein [Patescibacteria group bacterium]